MRNPFGQPPPLPEDGRRNRISTGLPNPKHRRGVPPQEQGHGKPNLTNPANEETRMAAKTEIEPKDAPGAIPPEGDALTIDITQDFEFPEGPEGSEVASAAEKVEPAKEPPKVEAEKVPGKVVPIGALHQERERRKGAEKESAYWRRVAADRDKLRGPQPEAKREP